MQKLPEAHWVDWSSSFPLVTLLGQWVQESKGAGMNQNEQMREALQAIAKRAEEMADAGWDYCENRLFEELQKMAEDALTAEPAPLVRLTEEEIHNIFKPLNDSIFFDYEKYAYAIMDALEAKNGGKV